MLAMSEPNINFHIQTRMNQFKIPTELIKKNFKNIQKLVEKHRKVVLDEVAKVKNDPNMTPAVKLELIRKLIKSSESFHRRLQLLAQQDEDYRARLSVRLARMLELGKYVNSKSEECTMDIHNQKLISWYREECNLLIVDFLLKYNHRLNRNIGRTLLFNMAKTNPEITKLIDFDLLESFNKVFLSIVESHDLSLVTNWFHENRSILRKTSSNLEFEINYCKFLSLIELGQVSEAIKFSKENLSSYGNKENYQSDKLNIHEDNLSKLKAIGGLLVYVAIDDVPALHSNETSISSQIVKHSTRFQQYKRLLSDERWASLAKCFAQNFTDIFGIPKNYPLFIYLSAGLSSLKTKSCYCNDDNSIFTKEELHINWSDPEILSSPNARGPNYYYKLLHIINRCPVCSPELYKLSRNLPFAQLITNIFSDPYKLPNGNIYPFNKLVLSPEQTTVHDPLTQEDFSIDNCVKVYPA